MFNTTLAQFNPTIGDMEGNFQKAKAIVNRAKERGSQLVIFPELSVVGYCPKDLMNRTAFVKEATRYNARWTELAQDIAILFGSIESIPGEHKKLRNVAIFAHQGVRTVQAKTLLPTYDVFDERRWFYPGVGPYVVDFNGIRIGMSICEDIWNDKEFWTEREYEDDPIADLCASGADILVNISASPFSIGKSSLKLEMLKQIAWRHKKTLIYVNQVGANDDVIYDGQSMVFDQDGTLIAKGPLCEEAEIDINLSSPCNDRPQPYTQLEEIYKALVLGTKDYARKCGFKKALIGLSGGIDSALTAVIATEALGKENVLGVAMPSKYSSGGSVTDAKKLADNLGIQYREIPIKEAHTAYMSMLTPVLGYNEKDICLWEENLQARIRGTTLMAISNEEKRLLLTTGNKSEVAVGYCTLYGDTCGGLAVLSDVFKTKVYALSKWINETKGREVIPSDTITKPPSAELKPGQVDQDSLPPYDQLDEILRLYIEDSLSSKEIISSTSLDAKVIGDIVRKVDNNEYKRKQLAPGLKITKKAFGTGRLVPITQNWRE